MHLDQKLPSALQAALKILGVDAGAATAGLRPIYKPVSNINRRGDANCIRRRPAIAGALFHPGLRLGIVLERQDHAS